MNEFLSALMQAVMIAAVPVIAGFAAAGLKALAAYFATKSENETIKKYLREAGDAIATAVTYVSQTYVDALKSSDSFTPENQKEALQKAMEKAQAMLSAEAIEFLEEAYGDLRTYLETKIEQEVRNQKILAPVTLEAITETIEV